MTNLQPGTVTTLGQLRPGDVGEWLDGSNRFLVTEKNRYSVLQFADSYCVGRGDEPVRYIGRGRIEPARIVMDSEPDRVAELESQVRTLRDTVQQVVLDHDAFALRLPEDIRSKVESPVVAACRAALAATAPKEKPCTT